MSCVHFIKEDTMDLDLHFISKRANYRGACDMCNRVMIQEENFTNAHNYIQSNTLEKSV